MNIITNKILSSLLVAVCFIQTATGQISCRAEIKDGLVAKIVSEILYVFL